LVTNDGLGSGFLLLGFVYWAGFLAVGVAAGVALFSILYLKK